MKLLFAALLAIACVTGAGAIKTADMEWHDASGLPVTGSACPGTQRLYQRLPDSLKGRVRDELWALGQNTAGLAIRFSSDAGALGLKWRALNKFNMNHMTPAGIRGLDLYALDDRGEWRWVNSARPAMNDRWTTTTVVTDMEPRMREYMLYLPLYDGVDSISIGTEPGAVVAPPAVDRPRRDNPVVMYGTSILQGGCATRPGMVHTSILERMLDREVINLGFSGNARLDPEVARIIAATPAGCIVIDALPNCTAERVDTAFTQFYEIIREAQPRTPIVVVESCLFPIMDWNNEVRETIRAKNATLARVCAPLLERDANLYYMTGDNVLDDREGSVDNYHLTDMGFRDFARNMYPLLNRLINTR